MGVKSMKVTLDELLNGRAAMAKIGACQDLGAVIAFRYAEFLFDASAKIQRAEAALIKTWEKYGERVDVPGGQPIIQVAEHKRPGLDADLKQLGAEKIDVKLDGKFKITDLEPARLSPVEIASIRWMVQA